MHLSQFLLILRARYKIFMLMLAVTVLTTITVSTFMEKTYKASAQLVLNYKGIDPVTGFTLPAQLFPGYMTTQVDIIKSQVVALKVVDALKLADNEELRQRFDKMSRRDGMTRDRLASALLRHLDVVPSHESNVLEISIRADSQKLASDAANAFVDAYQQTSIDLKVAPLKMASSYFRSQIQILRENYSAAQRKLSEYQRDKGIVSADVHYDVESSRLNELSAQLVTAQAQNIEASSRRQHRGDSADTIANPLIQNLAAGLATSESKLAEISKRLGENHPQYLSAKAETEKMQSSLRNSVNAVSNSLATNAEIMEQRESAIRAALAVQKARVIELNGARSELAVYEKEVEGAQRAYETTVQRFTQTNLEAQSNQADVSVIAFATPPLAQASPKILLNTMLSVLIGTLLGIGFCLMAEMVDRRVRSADDLVDVLQAPVLGIITAIATKPRRSFSSLLPIRQKLLTN